jgi:hypothetical protein
MPYYQYKCKAEHLGHDVFEVFFKSFKEAEPFLDSYPTCPKCTEESITQFPPQGVRVMSVPMPPHLYGNPDGYHNPSPTKRHSTKLVSVKDGNKYSAS